jgi:hypothetical protein
VPDGVIAPASQTELELGAFEDDEAAELSVTTTREWLTTVSFWTRPLDSSELRLGRNESEGRSAYEITSFRARQTKLVRWTHNSW